MAEEKRYVTGAEQDIVVSSLREWMDLYPGKPVQRIESEFAPQDRVGMAILSVTGAYKTANEYINGAYEAQYQFVVLYHAYPTTSAEREAAIGVLNSMAAWAESQTVLPDLGAGKKAVRVERTSSAVMIDRYEDNGEDYQIQMVMDYEVRP